jgi:dienelactone hydrolase
MLIWRVLIGSVLALGISAANATDTPARTPAPTGPLRLTFTERSPYSATDLVLQRMGYSRQSIGNSKAFEYDLSSLSFEAFVPRSYSPDVPHGLFVWLGVTDVPPAWVDILARHKLVLVSANTRTGHPALYGPPLDIVHNMAKRYNIDEDRVYASGFSAGGQMATMMVRAFPEVFRGGLFLMGGHFYQSRMNENGQRESTVEESFPAWKGPLNEIKTRTKLVMMKAQRDTQWTAQEGQCDYQALLLDGFTRVRYLEVPGLGHLPPNAGWFQQGVAALDQGEPLIAPVVGPTTDPNPLPTQIAQAQRILAAGRYYLELKVPQGPREMRDRIQKSYLDKARKYLEQVLAEYPTTPAAIKARELLGKMAPAS